MRRIFLRGVMAVTEAGETLTKTVSQHCDGGDNVPTYSIYHRKHGLRLGGVPWLHGRRVRTPQPGPKRPTEPSLACLARCPRPRVVAGLCVLIHSTTSASLITRSYGPGRRLDRVGRRLMSLTTMPAYTEPSSIGSDEADAS